jgi:cyanophycinase
MKRYLAPLLVALVIAAPAEAAKKQNYFRVGSSTDGTASMNGGVVLMGGSTDVDDAFKWMCGRAVGGDFLVVRATGTDAYSPYVQALCPNAHSVATVIVNSVTAANDPVNVPTWIWPR